MRVLLNENLEPVENKYSPYLPHLMIDFYRNNHGLMVHSQTDKFLLQGQWCRIERSFLILRWYSSTNIFYVILK